MSLRPDHWIRAAASNGMIQPFEPVLVRESIDSLQLLSFGLSSYGYDLRLSSKDFKIFRRIPGYITDPKDFCPSALESAALAHDEHGVYFVLPAHSYGLGVSLEYLDLPGNVTALFIGKSTYAHCGVIANTTPGEAGWRGHLTIELSNSSSSDCRIYANEGIVQALFFESGICETSYANREGKYQDQPESVVFPKV